MHTVDYMCVSRAIKERRGRLCDCARIAYQIQALVLAELHLSRPTHSFRVGLDHDEVNAL